MWLEIKRIRYSDMKRNVIKNLTIEEWVLYKYFIFKSGNFTSSPMVSRSGCFFISPLSFFLLYVHETINGRLVSSYVSSFIFVNYLCTYVIYLFTGANKVERERDSKWVCDFAWRSNIFGCSAVKEGVRDSRPKEISLRRGFWPHLVDT